MLDDVGCRSGAATSTDGLRADRRQVVGGALLFAALFGTPFAISGCSREGGNGEAVATDSEKKLLERLSDIVVPATDTPGALAVGVPGFLELALIHGLEETAAEDLGDGQTKGRGGLVLLDTIARDLDQRAAGRFIRLPEKRQVNVLREYDAAAYVPDQGAHPWRKLKSLILLGYYTSEAGASKELRYELVPGRWDPSLPLPANNRSWSSDWTAVDFG